MKKITEEISRDKIGNYNLTLINKLEQVVSPKKFSYGYCKNGLCISCAYFPEQGETMWQVYYVNNGIIKKMQRFDRVYDASLKILKEIAGNEDKYHDFLRQFNNLMSLTFPYIVSDRPEDSNLPFVVFPISGYIYDRNDNKVLKKFLRKKF